MSGTPTLRTPSGEEVLSEGDVVCFPVGPEGAHKVTNTTETLSRVVLFSTQGEPTVAFYPDSDKVGVWTGNDADKAMFLRSTGDVAYFAGE